MSESKSLIRQWRLLRQLADARVGYTLKELHEDMSVSIETIRRDLNDLGLAGFRVRASVGFRGVKRWIMSFGPNATVLEPQELIEEIQNDLAAMTAAYGYRTIK